MRKFEQIAILGAGTIGMSWAALFLATGRLVTIFDPAEDVERKTLEFIDKSQEALPELGWKLDGIMDRLSFTTDPAEAVTGADFIQESIPERLEIKHRLYNQIEPVITPTAIIGTSTSGLKLSDLQKGFSDPARLILAHPFNPPHLIPLVELMINEKTASDVLPRSKAFFESIGKVTVQLNKEIPGHIANRLQAAIWREVIHLANEGVASVEDIDKAVVYGPGLRWAAMGPNTLFHLGGGADGIEGFCKHLGGPFQSWWNDLGKPELDVDTIAVLKDGMARAMKNSSMSDLAARRDELILGLMNARRIDMFS
ncbi:3-hydroxyacyl-CoA dehydrogenase NAD-binding domain-containing protein [Sneathiella marina]|uniref:3-hydroxyacyl-CoA dehydrogenase NAD-binding domain-containing protein n=1 Tax=Sneathiella marina TaxID=2950108 RepID=A0ABY4W913_9PROT|nr:3-hydroxyacyl-CoA dehydrogenase NAD-binding domain-containing protein [Sneathiella marina]USG62417.1 3-hydroxyacyl-CoA dehydrogenase NAD-binding domain-containing protein [Sneathiella marina]